MSSLAETVETSVAELQRMTDIGAMPQDLSNHLVAVMNISRTGRLFGHHSAVTFPQQILEMTEACSNFLSQDNHTPNEINEKISKKFAGNRGRRPTELNKIIRSVVDDITHSMRPTGSIVLAPAKQSWFKALFGR